MHVNTVLCFVFLFYFHGTLLLWLFVSVCEYKLHMKDSVWDVLYDNPAFKAVAKIVRWINSVIPWVAPKPSRVRWNGFFQFYRNSVSIETFTNGTTLAWKD